MLAVLAGVAAALAWCGPAGAHGADAPVAANYRVVVGEVSVPGVRVRPVEGGARLELTNASGREVVVLGLQGEEFLRVRPGGVDENRRSPTWFASRSLTGTARGGDASAAPEWHTLATEPVVRWHDERARELPARAWSVPLLVDGRDPGIVRGTIEPAPAPPTGWWWAGALVAGLLVAGLHRRRWAVVGVAVAAGGLTVAWIAGSAVLATSPADGLGIQLLARLWPLLTGVGVVAAGIGLALRRIDLVVAIAGACLAVMVGFAESAVFRDGVLAGPGWGRWAVAAALAGGLGLAVSGAIRWYRTAGTEK
ncbi:hypothetical protein ACFFX1_24445 [Dactylosporangium sucinum]|uniref:Integral membrane protein n=1 Tax=Dactylosporangium sucinum TaxID=1424081 RepID=A0A917WZD5_9ACTN|nr:hypothetical protein [Dactylosporangium sucinum]GGM44393.1 hypothetical protein GCM10007977_052470 [Dactylosporangium sucinum]